MDRDGYGENQRDGQDVQILSQTGYCKAMIHDNGYWNI